MFLSNCKHLVALFNSNNDLPIYSLLEQNDGDPIPQIVKTGVNYLEQDTGLDTEGLFR